MARTFPKAVEEVEAKPEPITVFYNGRYPNERVYYREDQDAHPSFDIHFKQGRAELYEQRDVDFLRRVLAKRGDVFEGKREDGAKCPLCARKGLEPIYLNGPALAAHMRITHE